MIQQQEQQPTYLFTLVFPGGEKAVLEVRGACSQDDARAIASTALPNCSYEVIDGDEDRKGAFCFYVLHPATLIEEQLSALDNIAHNVHGSLTF